MDKLKPCPFCGYQPKLKDEDTLYPLTRNGDLWNAVCAEPYGGCSAHILGRTKEEAIKAWNTRPPTTEEIEADFHRAAVKIIEGEDNETITEN